MIVSVPRAGARGLPSEPTGSDTFDREHFLDAQRRARRRTWRAAALAVPAVMIAGIPLCTIVAPLVLAPAIALGFLLQGINLLPTGTSSWIYEVTHILPDSWSAVRHGTPVSPALIASTFFFPGAVTMLAIWLALRILLGRAWTASVLFRLGGRDPDPLHLDERALCNIAGELAIAAGVRSPRVLLIDTEQANGTIVGDDTEGTVLLVSTGLLKRLKREEIQAFVAHLIASGGNGDLKIAATFFSVFQAWGALSLLIEAPFNPQAREGLAQTWRALRGAAAGVANEPAERVAVDALLEGTCGDISVCERFMDGEGDHGEPPRFPFDLLFVLRDMVLSLTSGLFAITAKTSIMLCTVLIFGPPISALWRSRRCLADAQAVELTRYPDALASALEKLHRSDVQIPGGEPVSFLFPLWPKSDPSEERLDIASFIIGMQLDPHKRLQGLRRLGSSRQVRFALGGWEGWRKEVKDLPQLLLWIVVGFALLAFMLALCLTVLGGLLWLTWAMLEAALVTAPGWIVGLF